MKNPTLTRPLEPGIATVLRMGRDMLGVPCRYFEQYGDTFGTNLCGLPLVMTRDPGWIKEVLVCQQASFVKDRTTRGLSVLLGEGLLTSDGDSWRRRRKLLQPCFQPTELGWYFGTFTEEAEREANLWRAEQSIDLLVSMTRMTLRVTLRTLFGADPDLADRFSQTMHAAVAYFEGVAGTQIPLPLWIPTPINRRFLKARRMLRHELAALIRDLAQQSDTKTLVGRLLMAQSAERLSEQEVLDEAITMLIAGHETSALSLTYTLALLAQHPLEQDAVAEELVQDGCPSTVASVRNNSALRRVLFESLRLYPVTWAVAREATSNLEVCGHRIVKGTQLYIHQWGAQRNEAYFQAPQAFRPSRWLDDAADAWPRGVYAPFGDGQRTCIGKHFALAEMMVALGVLLSRYRLSPSSPFPGLFQPSISLRPASPVILTAEARRTLTH